MDREKVERALNWSREQLDGAKQALALIEDGSIRCASKGPGEDWRDTTDATAQMHRATIDRMAPMIAMYERWLAETP